MLEMPSGDHSLIGMKVINLLLETLRIGTKSKKDLKLTFSIISSAQN
jgi:hypothetical protein